MNRSQWILDIEHDLSLIKDRLNKLEDHFEDAGVISLITDALYKIAAELERVKAERDERAE